MQEEIPDWKKGGMVVSDLPEEDEAGLLRRAGRKVVGAVANTSAGQKISDSDMNKDINKFRAQVKEFRGNLKEELDHTQNPFVQRSREVIDIAFIESGTAKAVKNMKLYDKEFDIEELPFEAEEVFKEYYCNFLAANIDYLEKVSSSAALAISKAEVKRRKEEGWEYRFTDILDMTPVNFLGGQVSDKGPPNFSFTVNVQEINCKQKIKDPEEIHSGSESSILVTTYHFVLSRHDDPDIGLTGHYWELIEFAKQYELTQLI